MTGQIKPLMRERVVTYYYCGNCYMVLDGKPYYCDNCGTRIDWGNSPLNLPVFEEALKHTILEDPLYWENHLKCSLEMEDKIREKRKELGDNYLKNEVGIDIRNLPE